MELWLCTNVKSDHAKTGFSSKIYLCSPFSLKVIGGSSVPNVNSGDVLHDHLVFIKILQFQLIK